MTQPPPLPRPPPHTTRPAPSTKLVNKVMSVNLFPPTPALALSHPAPASPASQHDNSQQHRTWLLYTKAKDALPDGRRMENLMWRLMALKIPKEPQNHVHFHNNTFTVNNNNNNNQDPIMMAQSHKEETRNGAVQRCVKFHIGTDEEEDTGGELVDMLMISKGEHEDQENHTKKEVPGSGGGSEVLRRDLKLVIEAVESGPRGGSGGGGAREGGWNAEKGLLERADRGMLDLNSSILDMDAIAATTSPPSAQVQHDDPKPHAHEQPGFRRPPTTAQGPFSPTATDTSRHHNRPAFIPTAHPAPYDTHHHHHQHHQQNHLQLTSQYQPQVFNPEVAAAFWSSTTLPSASSPGVARAAYLDGGPSPTVGDRSVTVASPVTSSADGSAGGGRAVIFEPWAAVAPVGEGVNHHRQQHQHSNVAGPVPLTIETSRLPTRAVVPGWSTGPEVAQTALETSPTSPYTGKTLVSSSLSSSPEHAQVSALSPPPTHLGRRTPKPPFPPPTPSITPPNATTSLIGGSASSGAGNPLATGFPGSMMGVASYAIVEGTAGPNAGYYTFASRQVPTNPADPTPIGTPAPNPTPAPTPTPTPAPTPILTRAHHHHNQHLYHIPRQMSTPEFSQIPKKTAKGKRPRAPSVSGTAETRIRDGGPQDPKKGCPGRSEPTPPSSSSFGTPASATTATSTNTTHPVTLTCSNCSTSTTPLWRRDARGQPLCNACGLFQKLHGTMRPVELRTDVIKKRNRSSNRVRKTGTGVAASTVGATLGLGKAKEKEKGGSRGSRERKEGVLSRVERERKLMYVRMAHEMANSCEKVLAAASSTVPATASIDIDKSHAGQQATLGSHPQANHSPLADPRYSNYQSTTDRRFKKAIGHLRDPQPYLLHYGQSTHPGCTATSTATSAATTITSTPPTPTIPYLTPRTESSPALMELARYSSSSFSSTGMNKTKLGHPSEHRVRSWTLGTEMQPPQPPPTPPPPSAATSAPLGIQVDAVTAAALSAGIWGPPQPLGTPTSAGGSSGSSSGEETRHIQLGRQHRQTHVQGQQHKNPSPPMMNTAGTGSSSSSSSSDTTVMPYVYPNSVGTAAPSFTLARPTISTQRHTHDWTMGTGPVAGALAHHHFPNTSLSSTPFHSEQHSHHYHPGSRPLTQRQPGAS